MNQRPLMILLAIATAILSCFSIGCSEDSPENYRALPVQSGEVPAINPPIEIRQSNWLGGPGGDEGSCAHASLTSMLHWQNEFALADRWKKSYSGGEYAERMRKRLDELGVQYAYTMNANLELLDYAHATRRGALLWWKPSHCCTFVGWVNVEGKVYAAILDNNDTRAYELTELSEFHKRWAIYGGFALTVLGDPPSPPPYLSYEPINY